MKRMQMGMACTKLGPVGHHWRNHRHNFLKRFISSLIHPFLFIVKNRRIPNVLLCCIVYKN